tara:strand:- start:177835 stop:178047 length:213 start_codon:yes stop_codon:yes gene_type:complete
MARGSTGGGGGGGGGDEELLSEHAASVKKLTAKIEQAAILINWPGERVYFPALLKPLAGADILSMNVPLY